MIEIIDNLLPEIYLRDLQNYFLSQACPWYFNDNLTGDESYKNLGSFGLVMRLYWDQMFINSPAGNLSKALILASEHKVKEILNTSYQVIRARADMTLYNPLNYRHEIHIDYPYEHITAIFYLNMSDGNTILFDRKGENLLQEIEPIENRLLIFDGLLQHTGHSPSNHKSRVLLNMNFMTPELINDLNQRHNRQ